MGQRYGTCRTLCHLRRGIARLEEQVGISPDQPNGYFIGTTESAWLGGDSNEVLSLYDDALGWLAGAV